MKKTTITGLIFMYCSFLFSQAINNFGVKIGCDLTNQYWDYKNELFSDLSSWQDNRIGFVGQFFIEKNLKDYLSVRSTLGYLQKGYVDDIKDLNDSGEEIGNVDNNVIFHDLSMDISIKFFPIHKNIKPYLAVGFRGDYLLDYKSVIIDFQGTKREIFTEMFDDFNKFTFGGLYGIGAIYKELVFIEFEYNPSFTKNYETSLLAVKDQFFSLTIGMNINQFIKNK